MDTLQTNYVKLGEGSNCFSSTDVFDGLVFCSHVVVTIVVFIRIAFRIQKNIRVTRLLVTS